MRTVLLPSALLALMLLGGGTAAAQTQSPFDIPGFGEGMRMAAELDRKIRQVRVEVFEIANMRRGHGTNDVFLSWIPHNEDPSLAAHRTGFCAMVKFPKRDWQEGCVEEYDTTGRWGRHKGIITMPYNNPLFGKTVAKVKVRCYATEETSYSPEYSQTVGWHPYRT